MSEKAKEVVVLYKIKHRTIHFSDIDTNFDKYKPFSRVQNQFCLFSLRSSYNMMVA